jgi:hypothetical protein
MSSLIIRKQLRAFRQELLADPALLESLMAAADVEIMQNGPECCEKGALTVIRKFRRKTIIRSLQEQDWKKFPQVNSKTLALLRRTPRPQAIELWRRHVPWGTPCPLQPRKIGRPRRPLIIIRQKLPRIRIKDLTFDPPVTLTIYFGSDMRVHVFRNDLKFLGSFIRSAQSEFFPDEQDQENFRRLVSAKPTLKLKLSKKG